MTWAARILPLLFAGVFLFAAMRRVKVYDSFAAGASEALPLLRSLFPYVAAVLDLTMTPMQRPMTSHGDVSLAVGADVVCVF